MLIHSFFINRRILHFVRCVSDLSAFFSIIFAILFLISAYRPNKTKTAIAWDLFDYGISSVVIQLCDAYMFLNRYRAVKKMPKWEQQAVHLYIILVTVIPYYTTITFLPFFFDVNNDMVYARYCSAVFLVMLWGTIAFNIHFTFVFSYLGYDLIQKNNRSCRQTNNVKWIIFKSLCHCVTSSIVNGLVYFSYTYNTFYFDSIMYNMVIVFGIHFFFNFKIESSSFMRLLVDSWIK